MKKKAWRTAVSIVLALVVVVSLGVSVFIQGYTLCEWWKPACGCALLGIIASIGLHWSMHRLTGTKKTVPNYAAALVLSYSVTSGSFYASNYCLSDADSRQNYSVRVVKKYSEEHYRTKRVSRHTAVRGEKYRVYYIDIALPDGRTKPVKMSVDEYAKVRRGQRINISVEEGLWGIFVIKGLRFPIEKYKRF